MSDNEYRVVRIDPIEGEIPQLWDARLSAPIYTLRILITLDDGDECEVQRRFPSQMHALAELARLPYSPTNGLRARFNPDGTLDALITPAMVTS